METRSKKQGGHSDCSSDHEVEQTMAKGLETQCTMSDGSRHQEFPPANDPEIVFNYDRDRVSQILIRINMREWAINPHPGRIAQSASLGLKLNLKKDYQTRKLSSGFEA